MRVELATGVITNITTGATAQAEPFSGYTLNILASGGIKPLIKQQMEQQQPSLVARAVLRLLLSDERPWAIGL